MSLSGVPEEEKQSGWHCEVDQTWLPPAPSLTTARGREVFPSKFAMHSYLIYPKEEEDCHPYEYIRWGCRCQGNRNPWAEPYLEGKWEELEEEDWSSFGEAWESTADSLHSKATPLSPTAASVALGGVCPWSTSLSQHKGTEERKIQGQPAANMGNTSARFPTTALNVQTSLWWAFF